MNPSAPRYAQQPPSQDPRVLKKAVQSELEKLKPRVEALEVIAGKMGKVADELHTVMSAAYPTEQWASPDMALPFLCYSMKAIAKAQMTLVEANLTSLSFQLSEFHERQSQLQAALENLDNHVGIPLIG